MGWLACGLAMLVWLVNVLRVVGFTSDGDSNGPMRVSATVLRVLGNPMILGCLIGIVLSLAPFALPDFAAATLELLADGALVTETLTVGAALQWQLNVRQRSEEHTSELQSRGH